MRIEDFDFELPPEQIAQHPPPARDGSRLLVAPRNAEKLFHHAFGELPALLREGDLIVVNDSRVFQARLLGRKVPTGGRAELLLVRPSSNEPAANVLASAPGSEWICLGQASKGLKAGTQLEFDGLQAQVLEPLGNGECRVRFEGEAKSLEAALQRAGRLPLPPYIRREPTPEDSSRYQTVYARSPGSVAAPTAGLHFTPALLKALADRGVQRAAVTLEVGPGTFMPVREGELDRHVMHSERYEVPQATVEAIEKTKRCGGRVIAIGTTVVRTLEAACVDGAVRSGKGETAIFIRPGHRFAAIDGLLTNFHLPRSTLLVLVSALLGRERTLSVYREAVAQGYRFFSYGDAMLIGDFP